jgi:hypothetical protein
VKSRIDDDVKQSQRFLAGKKVHLLPEVLKGEKNVVQC